MKKIRIALLSLLVVFTSAYGRSPKKISLDDVVSKVSKQNFLVLENAQRVYQKKELIKYSRGSLLPKLNIWNLLKIPAAIADPLSAGDLIQDFAPFLIPANWFKLRQSKIFHQAQREQYHALWANEVSTAKQLFLSSVRNISFFEILKNKMLVYDEILEIAKNRTIFGNGSKFALNLLKERRLALREDERNLENLIYTENKGLQYLLGINSREDIELKKVKLPNLEEADEIEADKIIFKAIEASPELRQYHYLIYALQYVKKEINFNILGTSTYSLGGGNGAFDHIPIQNGLGFGNASSMRITRSEGQILKIQMNGVQEIIKKQIYLLVQEFNSLIEFYDIAKMRLELAEDNYDSMYAHLKIGGELDFMEMQEIIDNMFKIRIHILSYQYRFTAIIDKLSRVTFTGDYSKSPVSY